MMEISIQSIIDIAEKAKNGQASQDEIDLIANLISNICFHVNDLVDAWGDGIINNASSCFYFNHAAKDHGMRTLIDILNEFEDFV